MLKTARFGHSEKKNRNSSEEMPKTPFRGPTKMKPTKLDFEAHAHSTGARTVKAEGRKNAAKSPAVKSVKSTAHKLLPVIGPRCR